MQEVTKDSSQYIKNKSFDPTYQLSMVEAVGFDSANNVMRPIAVDATGKVKTNADALYQQKENQRLSTSNSPTFTAVTTKRVNVLPTTQTYGEIYSTFIGIVATTNATPATYVIQGISSIEMGGVFLNVSILATELLSGISHTYILRAGYQKIDTGITMVGSLYKESDSTSPWDATMATSGSDINVTVTGAGSTNINWVIKVERIAQTTVIAP